ncbi:MAG: PhzF family phenazine biosynthesis protein [bacterium]
MFEDPATGTAAGALGAFLAANGHEDESGLSQFIIDQGDFLGRPSRIYVNVEQEGSRIIRVEVSGYCRHVFEATMKLDE